MDQKEFIDAVTGQLEARVASGLLKGWTLTEKASRSDQRLYASPDGQQLSCHQSRHVAGTSVQLAVLSVLDEAHRVGTATVDLVPFRPVDAQLEEVIELSRCSCNPAWNLAEPPAQAPAVVLTCDERVRDCPQEVIASMEAEFAAAIAETSGCRLNSAELFLNYSQATVHNSAGLTYSEERSDCYLEAAMEQAGQENDKEVHEHETAVTAEGLNVREFVKRCALQVAVLGDSEEPQTAESMSILIHKEPISQMLSAVVGQLDCAREYQHLPCMKPGDRLGGGEGDGLHLRLDPTLPCMALSGAYTSDGLVAQSRVLIEHNRVVERVVGNRFGQYLKLEPNGICGNLVLEAGTLKGEELVGQEYLEVIKFSSLLIDDSKLTWSSEIKLGRHVATDGTVTLVKGGVVSGNLKENFTHCRLSETLGRVNVPGSAFDPARGYRGPDAMLITRGVSIAGKSEGENA